MEPSSTLVIGDALLPSTGSTTIGLAFAAFGIAVGLALVVIGTRRHFPKRRRSAFVMNPALPLRHRVAVHVWARRQQAEARRARIAPGRPL